VTSEVVPSLKFSEGGLPEKMASIFAGLKTAVSLGISGRISADSPRARRAQTAVCNLDLLMSMHSSKNWNCNPSLWFTIFIKGKKAGLTS
jgi:hypothetical protein